MVNVFAGNKKKEPNDFINQQEKQETPEARGTEQPQVVIQQLKLEQAKLSDEKQSLLQLKEDLKRKINDKIENSKNNLQKLKSEVDALKAECAQLDESLQFEVLAQ